MDRHYNSRDTRLPERSRVFLQAATVIVMVATAVGCSSDPPQVPVTPVPDAGVPPTADAGPPPVNTAPPPPPAVASGPCDGIMHTALQTAIQARGKQELTWGMKPEGAYVCQNVSEGGAATVAVTLQPGRCYTFLGHAFPNVTELDLFLKPNFGPNPMPPLAAFANTVLAQDSDTGLTAAIGRGKNCYKNPFPVPGAGIIEVKARTGAGPVAVQVYSR